MGYQELLKPSPDGEGGGGKTDYSLGLGGQDFLVCYISQSVYKSNADRKFDNSLTVERERHPSRDAGIRPPLPSHV